MPPEISEAELKALREAKEAAERREALVRSQAAALQTQVANYVTAQQQAQQHQGRPVQDEDPDAFVSRKELMEAANALNQQSQQTVQQSALMLAKNHKATNRSLFFGARDDAGKPKHKYAAKYAAEIDQMVDSLDPVQAAAPGVYEEIYNIVRGRHFQEIAEIEFAERQAAERAKQVEADQYEDEPVEEGQDEPAQQAAAPAQPARATQPAQPRRTETPVPSADATGVRPGQRRLKQAPLTPDEEFAAKRFFNGDPNEYRKWKNGEATVDMFGAKGRTVF